MGLRDWSTSPRGSRLPLEPPRLAPEVSFRHKVLETLACPSGRASHEWARCRPLPQPEAWFETIGSDFTKGKLYG